MLRRAVASALACDAAGAEVLVVDDHSGTPASEVLADFADARLRIVRNPAGHTGVAATRNTGFREAKGEVIFFLDDDDEMLPDYPGRVLAEAALRCEYGFSSWLEGRARQGQPATAARVRFAEGPIPSGAPLRKRLCGFGMGFWIRRDTAREVGPVATDLTMNEDTEYLCKLITAGRTAWYSARPGVIIHAHPPGQDEAHHLTKRTSAVERARCMRVLCERYPKMVGHLGSGYIRHCLKSGLTGDARRFVANQPDWRVRARLGTVLVTRYLAYALTRRGA